MPISFPLKKPSISLLGLACTAFSSLVIAQPTASETADVFLEDVSISPNPAFAGQDVKLTIKVKNYGPASAKNVVLTNTIPEGMSLKETPTTTNGTCNFLNGDIKKLQCKWDELLHSEIGGTEHINTVDIILKTETDNIYNNIASVTSDTIDPNKNNNIKTNSITIKKAANLNISAKSYGYLNGTPTVKNEFKGGEPYYYEVKVDNILGPNPLPDQDNITVSFKSPFGSTITSDPSGDGWDCTPSTGYPLSTSVGAIATPIKCSMQGPLNVGETAPPIKVPMIGNSPMDGDISATFEVNSTYGNGGLGKNSDSLVVKISPGVDMAIEKSVTYANNGGNASAIFTLQAMHNGGGEATNITVTDSIDPGLTIIEDSIDAKDWKCKIDPIQTLTCTFDKYSEIYSKLPPIKFTTKILDPSKEAINEASISADQIDPDLNNNTSHISVFNATYISIQKTPESKNILDETSYFWKITNYNNGPLDIPPEQTVRVTEKIPNGMTIEGLDIGNTDDGWQCYNSNEYKTPASYPVTGPAELYCQYTSTYPIKASRYIGSLYLIARNKKDAGILKNEACVTLHGDGPIQIHEKPNTTTCIISESKGIPLNETVDLSITKTVENPKNDNIQLDICKENTCSYSEGALIYTITVKNLNGENNNKDNDTIAKRITLSDYFRPVVNDEMSVHTKFEITKGNKPQNKCETGGGIHLVCEIEELAPNEEFAVKLTIYPIITDFGGEEFIKYENIASVTTYFSNDRDLTNNKTTASAIIIPTADLSISKSTAKNEYEAGSNIEYTLAIDNKTAAEAYDVIVEDIIPDGMQFSKFTFTTPDGDCSINAGNVKCTWERFEATERYIVRYIAIPEMDSIGKDLINTATVSSSTFDPDTSNNKATSTIKSIAPEVDVLIKKSTQKTTGNNQAGYDLGEVVQYTIEIDNIKKTRAYNLEMIDTFGRLADTAIFSYQGGLKVTSNGNDIGTDMCNQPKIGESSGRLSCQFDVIDIADGINDESGKIIIRYNMHPEGLIAGSESNYSGSFYNHAEVFLEADSHPNDNEDYTIVTTRQRAASTDYQINKTSSKSILTPGEQFIYTLSVLNNGPNTGEKATVYDNIPEHLEIIDKSDACHIQIGSTNNLICSTPALELQKSVDFEITVRVMSPYTGPTNIINEARVDLNGDTNPNNNQSSVTVTVTSSASSPVPVPNLSHRHIAILMGLLLLMGIMTLKRRKHF